MENSEEEEKVITKKDPKRVEQGKKLAAISKEAKERKMRKRIEEERESDYSRYIFPGIALVSSISFLYLLFFAEGREKVVYVPSETPDETKTQKKYESLD